MPSAQEQGRRPLRASERRTLRLFVELIDLVTLEIRQVGIEVVPDEVFREEVRGFAQVCGGARPRRLRQWTPALSRGENPPGERLIRGVLLSSHPR